MLWPQLHCSPLFPAIMAKTFGYAIDSAKYHTKFIRSHIVLAGEIDEQSLTCTMSAMRIKQRTAVLPSLCSSGSLRSSDFHGNYRQLQINIASACYSSWSSNSTANSPLTSVRTCLCSETVLTSFSLSSPTLRLRTPSTAVECGRTLLE